MYALTRRIPEHQNMDQNVWKKRIKSAAIRLEGVMLLGSMVVVQMHAAEGSDIFTKSQRDDEHPVQIHCRDFIRNGRLCCRHLSVFNVFLEKQEYGGRIYRLVKADCCVLDRDHADGIHHLFCYYKPWNWGQRILILRGRNQFPDREISCAFHAWEIFWKEEYYGMACKCPVGSH